MRNYIMYINVSGETWRSCDLSIIIISILISFYYSYYSLLLFYYYLYLYLVVIFLSTSFSRSNLYRGSLCPCLSSHFFLRNRQPFVRARLFIIYLFFCFLRLRAYIFTRLVSLLFVFFYLLSRLVYLGKVSKVITQSRYVN